MVREADGKPSAWLSERRTPGRAEGGVKECRRLIFIRCIGYELCEELGAID